MLDVASAPADDAAFERIVSAAASVATAHRARGDVVRLVTSDHRDTGWVAGQAAFDALMEELALLRRTPRADLGRALRAADPTSDVVVVVAGDLSDEEVARLPARGAGLSGHRPVTVVRFRPTVGGGPARSAVARVVDVGPDERFPDAWARTGLLLRPVGAGP